MVGLPGKIGPRAEKLYLEVLWKKSSEELAGR